MTLLRDSLVLSLADLLGEPIKGGEDEVRFCSPFHEHFHNPGKEDRGYHLYVNIRKKVFIDYKSCLSGGVRYLFKLLGASWEESEESLPVSPVADLKERLEGLDSQVDHAFVLPTAKLPDWYVPAQPGSPVWNYLLGRGLTEEDILIYQVGEGTGEHADWVVIPSFNRDGVCEYYNARNIYAKVYRNPTEPRKYHVGFLHLATWFSPRSLIICEGCFSAICAGRDAVATYGKFVSNHQLWRIRKEGVEELTIALDPDAEKEALDTASRALRIGFKTYLVSMPGDFDPADLGRELFREYYNTRIEVTECTLFRKRLEQV